MKIKRGERERIQIPFLQRPDRRRMAELLREKIIEARVVQPPRIELRGGFFRRERLRLEMSAARNGENPAQQRPGFAAGRHALKLLAGFAPDQNYPADDNKFIWNSGAVQVDVIHSSRWHNASLEIKTEQIMKNKFILAGLAAAAMVFAGCETEKQEQAELRAQAKISKEQAQQTALAKAPGGTVKEAKLEKEKGKLIWSFDIATPYSKDITEVNVDAITGDVVGVEKEKPENEAKEKG
jgi:uncharacterized membrane protein YkoI